MKTLWTDQRLQRLFRRYNKKFGGGKLPHFLVVNDKERMGCRCDKRRRRIAINTDTLRSDREVRTALVHDMGHITAGGYGKDWQREMERLSAAGAPGIKRELTLYRSGPFETRRSIVESFSDTAWEGTTWEGAIMLLGRKFNLISSDGKTISKWAAVTLTQAKKALRRVQRLHLHNPATVNK